MKKNKEKSFNEQCYEIIASVPKGKVITYKEVAETLHCKAYRAVGNAMNKNPHDTSIVPCHRVIKTNGEVGGYAWDIDKKIRLLREEGVEIVEVGSDKTKWKVIR